MPGETVTARTTAEIPNVATRLSIVAKLMPSAIAIAEPNASGRRNASTVAIPPAAPIAPVAGQTPDDSCPGETPVALGGPPAGYDITTFARLDQRSTAVARGLLDWGVRPGMRVAMLVPFSAQFIELAFGLLKAGVVVVLIDPGMGRKHLVRCLAEAQPDGFLGIPKAQAIRTLLRRRFPSAAWNVTVGRRWFWRGKTLDQIIRLGESASAPELPETSVDDEAAIIFTTGSTGPPKGVLYTHGTFHAQINRIQSRYDIHRGSRDLACFPLFGLFDAVMGVTTIIPDMDPTRPADVDPAKLIRAAADWEVDQAFGSPALWNTVVRYCKKHVLPRPFPTLRRVLSAGAPVPASTLQSLRELVHPEADIVTPYGATEALPIASIESRQIITHTGPAAAKGKGVCVGTRFDDVQWRVIEIVDGPVTTIDQTTEVRRGKIGELMVAGPMVTKRYVVRTDQNDLHKVRDGDQVWHRMGDVGYLDAEDRFWFCGRKAHRVVARRRTYFSVPCEAIFNAHRSVYRSALVGRGERPDQTPVIMVELLPEFMPVDANAKQRLTDELLRLARRNPITASIEEIIVRDSPLPVDIRHNSKIFRERLVGELPPTR